MKNQTEQKASLEKFKFILMIILINHKLPVNIIFESKICLKLDL